MAAPMCRGKLLAAIFCSRNLQVQHKSLPLTLRPDLRFSHRTCSLSTLSSQGETASCKPRGMDQQLLRMNKFKNTNSLDVNSHKIFSIGCRSFASATSTDNTDGTMPPPTENNLPTTVKIKTLDTIGQRIRPHTIHLFNQEGISLGAIHSYKAVKLSNENSGLKLVLIDAESKPYPAYRLMTPQQLLDERAKLREAKKASKGEGVVQTMRFSSDITAHDLSHKVKKIDSFLEKKALVKISINPRGKTQKTEEMMKLADNIFKSLTTKAAYQTPPTTKGAGVMCVLRPKSDKEGVIGKKK